MVRTSQGVQVAATMSIRRYLKPVNGLPNPRGSLSANLPSAAIASANREVEKDLLLTAASHLDLSIIHSTRCDLLN